MSRLAAIAFIVSMASFASGVCACRGAGTTEGPDPRESPQASAEPAPLAVTPTTTPSASPAAATSANAAPLHGDEHLEADTLSREPVGYTLSAAFRLADLTGAPRTFDVHGAGLEAARKNTELRLAIDLVPTRLRVALVGHGFALPPDTEIRARSDRAGHVVVWPGATTYRPLPPGALRALFGERRFDVAPLTRADVVPRDDVGRRIGIYVRKVDLTTRAAKATFEIGKLEGAGEGGVLLCRMLLDLMNAPPSTPACAIDEVPLRAELRWTGHGSLVFELTGVLKKTDVATASLAVPPSGAVFTPSAPAAASVTTMFTPQELAAFRIGPIDVPPNPQVTGDDLVVANSTLELRALFLDGVPIAWVAPGAREVVRGLHRGRYIAQWRTFLGDAVEAPITQTVPGIAQIGGPDAGAR